MSGYRHPSGYEQAPGSEPGAPRAPGAPPEPVQRRSAQKSNNRRTMLIFLAVIVLLIVIGYVRSSAGGGGISATKIGPLEIGKATEAEAHLRFGLELQVWTKNGAGAPVRFQGQLWRYGCGAIQYEIFGAPCRTLFGFRNGHLVSVLTNNVQFSTHAGTRIGSTVAQAEKRDHGRFSGWNVSCPAVTFPSAKGVVFQARLFRDAANPGGVVSGFYLSTTPGSFGPC
jgi:hypothetical protein